MVARREFDGVKHEPIGQVDLLCDQGRAADLTEIIDRIVWAVGLCDMQYFVLYC